MKKWRVPSPSSLPRADPQDGHTNLARIGPLVQKPSILIKIDGSVINPETDPSLLTTGIDEWAFLRGTNP